MVKVVEGRVAFRCCCSRRMKEGMFSFPVEPADVLVSVEEKDLWTSTREVSKDVARVVG